MEQANFQDQATSWATGAARAWWDDSIADNDGVILYFTSSTTNLLVLTRGTRVHLALWAMSRAAHFRRTVIIIPPPSDNSLNRQVLH